MKNIIKHKSIRRCFSNVGDFKSHGVWLSGIYGEGGYKEWHINGQLRIRSFYKNNKNNGEYKSWLASGLLITHYIYKNNKIIKDYLE